MKFIVTVLFTAIFSALGSLVAADIDRSFSPIFVDEEVPDTFFLIGDIDGRTSFNFKRAILKYGKPRELRLTSLGGLVHEGLSLALEIKDLKIKTVVVDHCYSACFYVFMAGSNRELSGKLGIHQISGSNVDLESGQVTVADIIDVLNQIGVNQEVFVLMFQTPSDEMHIFSQEEISEYQLEGTTTNLRDRPEADLDKANRLFNEGNYKASVEAYEVFIANFSDSSLVSEAWLRLGDGLNALNNRRDAARAYLNGFSHEPGGIWASHLLLKLGVSLIGIGQPLEGCITLDEVVTRFPQSEPASQVSRVKQALGCPS